MKFQKPNPFSLVLLSLLVASQPVLAQKSDAKAARLPLWKIEGKTNSVYLLGSVHILSETNYPLAAPIESAFKSAQVVAFETDVGAMSEVSTQMKLLSKAQLPEGETLKDQLSAETYAALMKQAEQSGLPEAMLTKFKPMMAAVTVLSVDLMKMGLNPEHGVDQHFHKRAKEDGKKIVPLETVDFQIDLLTGLTKEEGELIVKSMLKDMANTRKAFDDIINAWKTGDAKALDKLLNEATAESPAVMKRLLTDRNENWMPKIQEMINSGKSGIVIVGAAHLVGDKGVVELLKKKGLKVTQL